MKNNLLKFAFLALRAKQAQAQAQEQSLDDAQDQLPYDCTFDIPVPLFHDGVSKATSSGDYWQVIPDDISGSYI